MLPPRTQLEAALQPSFNNLRPLHHEEDNALYGPAVTAFSMLDGALVRHGLKSDTDIRNELRDKLKDLSALKNAKPAVDALKGIVERISVICGRDRRELNSRFVRLPEAVGRAAIRANLTPFQVHWVELLAYSAVVAYGPAGAAVPTFPQLPSEKGFDRIRLTVIPGDAPGDWYGDDGEEGSGMPDHDHELPTTP